MDKLRLLCSFILTLIGAGLIALMFVFPTYAALVAAILGSIGLFILFWAIIYEALMDRF